MGGGRAGQARRTSRRAPIGPKGAQRLEDRAIFRRETFRSASRAVARRRGGANQASRPPSDAEGNEQCRQRSWRQTLSAQRSASRHGSKPNGGDAAQPWLHSREPGGSAGPVTQFLTRWRWPTEGKRPTVAVECGSSFRSQASHICVSCCSRSRFTALRFGSGHSRYPFLVAQIGALGDYTRATEKNSFSSSSTSHRRFRSLEIK